MLVLHPILILLRTMETAKANLLNQRFDNEAESANENSTPNQGPRSNIPRHPYAG